METKSLLLDEAVQTEVIQSLSEKLRACYLFPEAAEQICAGLQKHQANGEYADITEGEFFAYALTLHMQEVNHDEHLWIRWHADPLPDHADQLRQNQQWQDERRLEARLANYGLQRVERLPGNVGYLDIHYFTRPAWGGETAAAAMAFLANTHALIIDLRKCTGGYPGMMALICSYLFGEEPLHLNSIYWRDDDITQQYWTLPYIPGKRLIDQPVYLLTSKITFSAAEGFASILQTRRRATLVGEKTDGGAHAGAAYRIHPHFEAFIPIGRLISPLNGGDLEGIGVTPDVSVPPEQAFKVAYQLALTAFLANLGDAPAGPLKDLAEEAKTALNKSTSTGGFNLQKDQG